MEKEEAFKNPVMGKHLRWSLNFAKKKFLFRSKTLFSKLHDWILHDFWKPRIEQFAVEWNWNVTIAVRLSLILWAGHTQFPTIQDFDFPFSFIFQIICKIIFHFYNHWALTSSKSIRNIIYGLKRSLRKTGFSKWSLQTISNQKWNFQ